MLPLAPITTLRTFKIPVYHLVDEMVDKTLGLYLESSSPRPTEPKQICFNYSRNGFCKFGSYCRLKNVNNNFNRDNVEYNSASFLGEI